MSLYSVVSAKWVYLQSPNRLHLLILPQAHLSSPVGCGTLLPSCPRPPLPQDSAESLLSLWLFAWFPLTQRALIYLWACTISVIFPHTFCWLRIAIFHIHAKLNIIATLPWEKTLAHILQAPMQSLAPEVHEVCKAPFHRAASLTWASSLPRWKPASACLHGAVREFFLTVSINAAAGTIKSFLWLPCMGPEISFMLCFLKC